MKLEEIQKSISHLFYDYFKEYKGGNNLSLPHIPLISEDYLNNRIIVLGQETNTWYRKGDDDLREIYLKNYEPENIFYGTEPYKQFIEGPSQNYGGKFWQFNRSLYSEGIIEGTFQKEGYLSHCWLNLFFVEAVKEKGDLNGRPSSNAQLRTEILRLQKDLLFRLIEILKPKVLIALTGKSLDPALFKDSLKLEWNEDHTVWSSVDASEIFQPHELSEVQVIKTGHPLQNTKILRAYHPTYFLGRINSNNKLKKIAEEKELKGNLSQHYQNVIFDWVRNTKQEMSQKTSQE
tara:strand:- start:347 stop:1219 length:873 start_codon:yes stop_codon:yes gene_type:complete